MPLKPYHISPVLPGTGTITHNVTRMLNGELEAVKKEGMSTARAPRYSPYNTSHFMSYRQKIMHDPSNQKQEGIYLIFYRLYTHCFFHFIANSL